MNFSHNCIILIIVINCSVVTSLTSQLNYYETISTDEIAHQIHKRSIDPHSIDSLNLMKEFKQIKFKAFNRKFNIILNERNQILDDRFQAFTVDRNGRTKEVKFDSSEFYEGNLIDTNHGSHVIAHIESKTGLITGSIYDDNENEAYYIEPYSNLIQNANKNETDEHYMIIYRSKDMKDQYLNENLRKNFSDQFNSMRSFCGKVDDLINESNQTRIKRQLDDENFWTESKLENSRCSLRLVADYTFFEQMGHRDVTKTINFLVNLISEVDTIFKRTNWTFADSDIEPMIAYGFLVTQILIHESPSYDIQQYPNSQHYNMEKSKWKVRELLEVFSRTESHKSFCLSHLFTHRTFENGILGLAYVSSPRQYSYGGICSIPLYKDGSFLHLNTGLTTTRNSFGNRVLTRQAVLITAHELGHNWGAEHDPNTPECSPKSRSGGAFIMNTFSVSSFDANNQLFSICSKRSIKSVLKVKARDCFSKPKSTFCGNGIVEKSEECDPGLTSASGDLYCTKNCRLRPGYQCSYRNSPCCNIQGNFAGFNKVCSDVNELDCKQESRCNGHSAECPKPNALPDETPCSEDGQCVNGECIPFCEKHNLHSCMCDRTEDACRKCCKESLNSTCLPYRFRDGDHYHRDGTICLRGFCAKGKCVNVTSQDYVERFWSIIDDIEYNSFTDFLKDNLVFVVIVLSLILFVPVCWFIDKYDTKRKEHEIERAKEKDYANSIGKQRPSSVYGNNSIRTAQRMRIPRNRQQFSTHLPTTGRRQLVRKMMDESTCTTIENNHKSANNSNDHSLSAMKNSTPL